MDMRNGNRAPPKCVAAQVSYVKNKQQNSNVRNAVYTSVNR